MLTRRVFAFGLTAAFALPARAAEEIPYTAAAFDAARDAGKSIVVVVHAGWCPTCRAQKPILAKLEDDPMFKQVVVFHVDFDSQKDALRRFGVRMQSTLIAFKGAKETSRSVGDTQDQSIASLFFATL
ncbi:MAG: thioredoxin family protein [Pseudomonadota bacterium]|nr:thioredoxin family protein [Pseudomonadota bacterium]